MNTNLIPTLDPNPLPAPYWVFQVLLVVTFFLHIVAMNLMLGGTVLALMTKWLRLDKTGNGNRIFFDIAKKLPVLLPATVTIGIAPLLFLQVIYGQYFYTSSVLVAWPWFAVLVALTLAYYGFYYASFSGDRAPARAAKVMLGSLLLVLGIGFVYSNNITLSQVPARWAAKYFAHPEGLSLNLSEPTLIPRFLHFMTAAVAIGGLLLVLMAFSKRTRDPEYARELFRFGGQAFLYATIAQFVVGIVFLISLPKQLLLFFLGGNLTMTILLMAGFSGGLAAILLMYYALNTNNIRFAVRYVTAATAVTILIMSVMRDMLRNAYLSPYFHPNEFVSKTQWSVFPLFLVMFVAGILLWLVMLKRYGLFRIATAQASSSASAQAQD